MALSLFSRKKRIINIIINDQSIRYVELKQTNPPIAGSWGERYFPQGIINNGKIADYEALLNILEECISEWKIQKRPIRFIVPDPFVIIRQVSIPADIKDDEIKSYLYLELGTSIHLPFEEPVFDAIVLSADPNKKHVLLFAAQEESVMDYSQLFTDGKLNPIAADISPLALYRLYHQLDQSKRDDRLLMVQFDLRMVSICIFENHIPFFMRHLPIELEEDKWDFRLNQLGQYEIKYTGDLKDLSFQLEDLYKEISKLMDFYRYSLHQGQKQLTKILLNGDHPMLPMIKEEMDKRFDLPIDLIDTDKLTIGKEGSLPRTHYLALGLALKEV